MGAWAAGLFRGHLARCLFCPYFCSRSQSQGHPGVGNSTWPGIASENISTQVSGWGTYFPEWQDTPSPSSPVVLTALKHTGHWSLLPVLLCPAHRGSCTGSSPPPEPLFPSLAVDLPSHSATPPQCPDLPAMWSVSRTQHLFPV